MFTFFVEKAFLIDQILECGQCFRYKKRGDHCYELIAYGQRLVITQENQQITLNCDEDRFFDTWHSYFDLNRSYEQLQQTLKDKDVQLNEAMRYGYGIRILRQEPFEMLVTFILSQNKSIPHIKALVESLSEAYGTAFSDEEGLYYAFPTPAQLADVTEEDYRKLKVGFRAPYLVDAVHKVVTEEINLNQLHNMSSEQARTQLIQIKGVGRKVADCVLLFGYAKMDVFPVDVWVRRIMTEVYFGDGAVSDQAMLKFADDYFEELGGIAQQYLFHYARVHGVGK